MSSDERVARSVALEQAYVHDVYEQYYDNPRSKPWPRVQAFLENLEPGSLVCDIGCGNGKYLNINKSIFNIGGEKSNRLGEVAREKENEVIALDNLALPFRDDSLDAVVSIAVVHHFATTERRVCALRELARVLRIGGRLIISVWAMEQSHRKFESQDVLVPWRRPRQMSSPCLELPSTTTTSEDDGPPPYLTYSDADSSRPFRLRSLVRRKSRVRKGRPCETAKSVSPGSSSLSSPNETCYSFVRKAIQKLAGGRRVGVHKPWFLDSWTTCANKEPPQRYDPDGCECCDCNENIQDIPIELRRIDDDDLPQRRQTFPSLQLINDISSVKSKSMSNIKTVENVVKGKGDGQENLEHPVENLELPVSSSTTTNVLTKPKLVKQKKSVCEEDADEALDQHTDMKTLVNTTPDLNVSRGRHGRGNVLKQRSLNEEILSTERLVEKETLRKNIQKQNSLNEDLIFQRAEESENVKDSFFSVSTSKRFQLIKIGLTNKIKNSTTNMEKVTGSSLKNGFVRMFQNWKSSDLVSPTISEEETLDAVKNPVLEEKKEMLIGNGERRHSKEDGSDSSKDSSLQSDTSVDSEDSFASVIFIPKSDPMSPTNLSPGRISPHFKNCSVPNSPRIKQSSCPTSPRIKQMPLAVYPLTKQLSSPKPSTEQLDRDHPYETKIYSNTNQSNGTKEIYKNLAQKYSVPQIPKFKKTSLNSPNTNDIPDTATTTTTIASNPPGPTSTTITTTPNITTATATSPENSQVELTESRNERLKKIKELLSQKPGFGVRSSRSNFPIVRQSSVTNGKVEAIAKPIPKLLMLELFNPETDDRDSDSSCVSSPDSVDSVINVKSNKKSPVSTNTRFKFPPASNSEETKSMSLLEAAANVANSLDQAVEKVIKSSPRAKRKLPTGEVLSILQRRYSSDTTPLLDDGAGEDWNEDCHKHLTGFADELSQKLLREIDEYQVNKLSLGNIDDPYINRLSEELHDLSELSAEIQKQNEYLARLSVSDSLYTKTCSKCKKSDCGCYRTKKTEKTVKQISGAECSSKVRLTNSLNKSLTNDSLRNLASDKCDMTTADCSQTASNVSFDKSLSVKKDSSSDSCASSDKGSSSTNSMLSSVATSINFGRSEESADGLAEFQRNAVHASGSSDGGSTVSLSSCPEWRNLKGKPEDRLSKETSSISLDSSYSKKRDKSVISETSQDSLPTDNMGGEITYHRYYHVFREGELDQLIEKYVENLHIISSYYDHSSWCIIAEKVQVWTI